MLSGQDESMSSLQLYRDISEIRRAVAEARRLGQRVGFVPTMGALHEGHACLIRAARQETGFVVVSIFVNPTQFGQHEDFSRYPRPFDADRELCARCGADAIFAPEAAIIYPSGFRTFVEVQGLQDKLCGASRPGHFRGVCTVVLKLFNIVQPDVAYFGQKDAQQAIILTRMVRDLDLPVEMRVLSTVREADGLALSSRNRYLDAQQRRQAPALWRALQQAARQIEAGERDPHAVEQEIFRELTAVPGAQVDYARVVSAETLELAAPLRGSILIAVAVFFGATRLIDNIQIVVP
jgi:pantoate--beta-alanine ligase